MTKKYKNPPIIESICAFQFLSKEAQDFIFVGQFYEKIKEEFPLRQQKLGVDLLLRNKDESKISHEFEFHFPIIQFFNQNKNFVIQLGNNLLTINYLKPYASWEEFKDKIFQIIEKYNTISNTNLIQKITLRYLNQININDNENLEDYLLLYPNIPHNINPDKKNFNLYVEFKDKEFENNIIKVNLHRLKDETTNIISVLLDIDFTLSFNSLSMNEISSILDKMHFEIENIFELCLTEKCKTLFN